MRRIIASLALLLAAGSLRAEGPARTPFASVLSLEGDVAIQRQGREDLSPQEGSELRPGDVLKVDPEASVELRLAEGHDVLVGGKTEVALERRKTETGRLTLLSLRRGELRCSLAKLAPEEEFEVHTPVAVAGVRGTDFTASYDPEAQDEQAAFSVFDGRLAVCGLRQAVRDRVLQHLEAGSALGVDRQGTMRPLRRLSPEMVKMLRHRLAMGQERRELLRERLLKRLEQRREGRGHRRR